MSVDEGVEFPAAFVELTEAFLGGRKLLGEFPQLPRRFALGREVLQVLGLDPVEEGVMIGRFLP